jgi:hypothetical protein
MRAIALTLLTLSLAVTAAKAKPGPTAVTIEAQPAVITYGSQTTLAGSVTSQQADVKVTVSAQQCGANSFKTLTSVTAATGGAWSTTAKPAVRTDYRAKAGKATSKIVTVQVHPLTTLAKVAAHRFRVRVTAAESLAGRIALFQRRTVTGWTTVKSVVLVQIATGPAPTIVSGKTFRSGIRRGKTVRILLTQRQVGTCYLPGISNTIAS